MTISQIQVGLAIQQISDRIAIGYTWDAVGSSISDSVEGYAFDAPDQESDIHFNTVEGALDDAFFCWLGYAKEVTDAI